MSNLSGEVTPESITQQLQELGITGDSPNAETVPEKEEAIVSKAEEAQDTSEAPKEEKEETVLTTLGELNEESQTEAEKEALEKGWKPDGPKSAEEFLRAEPLYEELKTRGKEIKELKSTIEELKSYMDQQRELGYKQATKELQERKIEAIKAGNVAQVEQIEQEMSSQKEALEPKQPSTTPEAIQFVEKHKEWINDPSYEAQQMREFVTKRDNELAAFNLSPEEHLKVLEKDLYSKYPQKFGTEIENTSNISPVESGSSTSRKTNKKNKVNFSDLSPEQKQCARHFEKRGIMKTDEYIKNLVELGEI